MLKPTDTDQETRRTFIAASGVAAGALGMAAIGGGSSAAQAVEINAMSPTPEQMGEFMALPDEGPVVMLNLLKFKPDGGATEYAKYGAAVAPILEKFGARVIFSARAEFCLIGNADWDAVAIVEYPRRDALISMVGSEEYQAIAHHREAGLEGQVLYALVQNDDAD